MKKRLVLAVWSLCIAYSAQGTETENLDIRALPVPGKMTIDGDSKDWDLSGGILACGDAETQRDRFSVWLHLMYDADQLYILARWKDETPMNNPGSSKGDMGFAGDCLQFRTIWAYDQKDTERVAHWTAWKDRDGLDIVDACYGRKFNEGAIRDAQDQGAQQEFKADPDGKGYAQEIAIPWKLITNGQPAPKAGDLFRFTLEPNFLIGAGGRLSIKDIFRAGVSIDRIFTFRGYNFWGATRLEPKGKVEPQKVRLSDGREFPVAMVDGLPKPDWTGLIQSRELTGFEPIAFDMPEDGFATVVIRNDKGEVIRHLLNSTFLTKGPQKIKWDGLRTPWLRNPGEPVAPGDYTFEGLWHKGLSLRFRGWACNAGSAPWDASATANWGGDHGPSMECASDGERVYLGWKAAESGKALLACNLKGDVLWRHVRGGIGGAQLIASDKGFVYYRDDEVLVKLNAGNGGYVAWEGRSDAVLPANEIIPNTREISGLAAGAGKLFAAFSQTNLICELDPATGMVMRRMDVPSPTRMLLADDRLLVISDSSALLSVNVADGKITALAKGFQNAKGIAHDRTSGRVFVSLWEPDHQVAILQADGKEISRIGTKGGRPARSPWDNNKFFNPTGMTVDQEGKLWVAEFAETPRRFSVWSAETGDFVRDFLGPTHYGASGGTILPEDPNIMVGEGCEWKMDPQTGRSTILGTYDTAIAGCASFHKGANSKTYLITSHGRATFKKIFERLSPGNWKLRATIKVSDEKNEADRVTRFWSDANNDELEQAEEVATLPYGIFATGYTGWSQFFDRDLSFNAAYTRSTPKDPNNPRSPVSRERRLQHIPVSGFTACGSPTWSLNKITDLAVPGNAGLNGPDKKTMCQWEENSINCYAVADGKLLWSYPNTYSGVHGSHRATAPELGMLRGAFGVIGTAALPTTGSLWALNGNCGEWYLFSEKYGFVSQLFQGDPMRWEWPEKALPGVLMDSVPPGAGAEDFGGSLVQADDGKIYIQSGKTGIWNIELTGTESIQPLRSGRITITQEELELARKECESQKQAASTGKRLVVKRLAEAPKLTGDLGSMGGAVAADYKKQDNTAIRTALAYDGERLYLHFEVKDETPWVNGADAPQFLYARGDTVDLQLGTDTKANPKRREAASGDLRLSIGNFQGKPTAMLYRKVADKKAPMTFSSGVVKAYVMDSVTELPNAVIAVKTNPKDKRYTLQASIPLSDLGLTPSAGLVVRGDVGVTHGDQTGLDTALRTSWCNQMTGLVSDEVFELEMKPDNWGELMFE